MKRFILPFVLFIVLVGFLMVGLNLNPREVPSPLIGKPVPQFTLTQLHDGAKTISDKDMLGKVWMVNVWASWCGACREEHPLMVRFAKKNLVPVIGLNYKDQRNDGIEWLKELGNPYQVSIFDDKGRLGIDFGVYGVPETFLIDKRGVIRFKQIGPMTPEVLQNKLLPLINELNRA